MHNYFYNQQAFFLELQYPKNRSFSWSNPGNGTLLNPFLQHNSAIFCHVVHLRYTQSPNKTLQLSMAHLTAKCCHPPGCQKPGLWHIKRERKSNCVLYIRSLCAYASVLGVWSVHEALPAACRQMVLIGSTSCLFFWWKSGRGQRETRGCSMTGGAPPAQLNPTSAARPVLADLKAVSAETEGAVSCHDAAIAAPELVAGWQELCRGKREREKRWKLEKKSM